MHVDLYIALAGLIVGFAVGLTGMGGGALMTPVLVLIFNVQPLAAVSSDLVASLLMKPLGAMVHVGHRTVRWGLVRWLALGSVPGALMGVSFLRLFGKGHTVQSVVSVALGSVLLLSVTALAGKWVFDRSRSVDAASADETFEVKRAATAVLGLVVGFIVGITATGSGTLIIVALMLIYPRLRGSQTVGTDLTQAIPMVGAAALGHILFGDFKFGLTMSIVLGAIPGVVAGSLLSARGSTGFIRAALSVVLLASGLKLVNVPTPVIGIAAVVAVVAAAGVYIVRRTEPRQQASAELLEAS